METKRTPADERRRTELVPFSNALLFLVFCLMAATGLAMAFRLGDGGERLFGATRHEWARVHSLAALSFVSVTLIHLWVNWDWVLATARRLRWPTLVVAFLGLALIAAFWVAPVAALP